MENLVRDLVLFSIFMVGCHPIWGNPNFAFLVAIARLLITHMDVSLVGILNFEMVGHQAQTFPLFQGGFKHKQHERVGTRVRVGSCSQCIGSLQRLGVFGWSEHRWERADDSLLDHFFSRVSVEHAALHQPAKKRLDGSDPAGESFGAAGNVAVLLEQVR